MNIGIWWKQITCAHEWKCLSVHYSAGRVTGDYQCKKCGKQTQMVHTPSRNKKYEA